METPERNKTLLIIGAGRFGTRAARILSDRNPGGRMLIVDNNAGRLSCFGKTSIETIPADGVEFMVQHFDQLPPDTTIVPALPVHLAAEWLKKTLAGEFHVTPVTVPETLEQDLPNTWRIGEDVLLTSYADFICPEDCEEPEYCTVSGEKRDLPMRTFLKKLEVEGFSVYVVPSAQLAPGVGGYPVAALFELKQTLAGGKAGRKWIVATACSCHGVLSFFEIGSPESNLKSESRAFAKAIHKPEVM